MQLNGEFEATTDYQGFGDSHHRLATSYRVTEREAKFATDSKGADVLGQFRDQ